MKTPSTCGCEPASGLRQGECQLSSVPVAGLTFSRIDSCITCLRSGFDATDVAPSLSPSSRHSARLGSASIEVPSLATRLEWCHPCGVPGRKNEETTNKDSCFLKRRAARNRISMLIYAVTAIVILTPLYFWDHSAALLMHATSPKGVCSIGQTITAVNIERHKREVARELAAHSKVVTTDGRLRLWETPEGRFWVNSETADDALFDMLSEQAVNIYGGSRLSVRAGDVALDCGANVGAFTRRALDAGASKVLAIEPTPELVECLRRTFANDARVIIVPKGVWDKEGSMKLSIVPGLSEGNSFVLHPEIKDGPSVPLTTIDHLSAGLPRVDFIKMDIEGAERNAIRGAVETLRKYHPKLAIEGHHLRDDPYVIPALVRSLAPDYLPPVYECRGYRGEIMPEALLFK
jgi:FkbM family methyltransferase